MTGGTHAPLALDVCINGLSLLARKLSAAAAALGDLFVCQRDNNKSSETQRANEWNIEKRLCIVYCADRGGIRFGMRSLFVGQSTMPAAAAAATAGRKHKCMVNCNC